MNTEIIIAFDGGINLKGVYTTQGKYHVFPVEQDRCRSIL